MDMNPPTNNDDELGRRIIDLVQQCQVILQRVRAGAKFSAAAQHDVCQAALRLYTELGLRLPPKAERETPPLP